MSHPLQQALEELYGLERRKDKLGLEGTRALLAALGNPERSFRSIHVAGTNGKGSVCAIVERVLREAGYRTGLFTSPHLVDFRERIRVNGRWADEAWLERALARIQALPEGKDRTFFEVVTALGFLYFAEQNVEWAVVEVGLGGRLDTTNVLMPEVCAITSIGHDHTEILGETIEEIAAEKAGIIKPGVPVVLGFEETTPLRVVEEIAHRVGAPRREWYRAGDASGYRLGRSYVYETPWGRFEFDDLPLWMQFNGPTALAVIEALDERGVGIAGRAVRTGLAAARWPGRLEPCPTEDRLWWDGAHNSHAVVRLTLAWLMLHETPPAVVVLALGRDKDADEIVHILTKEFANSRLIVTRTRSERARAPEDLAELARARGAAVETAPDVPMAVERALAVAGNGKVLLTGSLFAVGEAMEAFGGAPGEQL